MRHARQLAESVAALADDEAVEVEARSLPFAAGRDLAAFARKVRREVLALDTRTVEQSYAAALRQRRVWANAEADAMCSLGAMLPAEGSRALMAALDLAAARCAPGDLRTNDQRRADALVQLGIDYLDDTRTCPVCVARNDNDEGDRPCRIGLQPAVSVSVALSTLLGIDENPGDLDGYGPIPAQLARRLAAEDGATWRRLVTDDVGRLVDRGRTTYRPPKDLREFVQARDRTCRFPTCNRRACACEVDHVRDWASGGATNADNLVALCARHHHGKHDAGWQLRLLDDATVEWTSSSGRTYLEPPATYPLDATFVCVVPDDNAERSPSSAA